VDAVTALRQLVIEAFWRSVVAGGGAPDVYAFALALLAAAIAAHQHPAPPARRTPSAA
jgi:hypothetical protein